MYHLIIGGGIAGTTCAEELRKLDPNAEITLVSEEDSPVYSRVLLPHYVKGKVPRERVFLKKETWYAESHVEWITDVRAEHLDVRNKFVALSNGREIEYDKLLIATGGEVRTAEIEGRNVSYFRTLGDAEHLVTLLAERTPETRGQIFGGGFIACEYLNIFAHFGISTTLSMRSDRFWSRVFDEETGKLVNDWVRANGVEIVTQTGNHPFTPPLKAGELIGVGIGIEPDFSLIREAGVETRSGIVTNEFLETNVPDVYAAGDIAEFYDVIVGRHLHVGNWMNAQMQGRHAAKVMMGDRAPFKLVSSYATNALGLDIIFVGDTVREAADEIVRKGSAADGGVTQLFIRAGKVVGATIVGRNADRQPVTNAIRDGLAAAELNLSEK
jgi:NAD(P)H-nitrite reductase large subunit